MSANEAITTVFVFASLAATAIYGLQMWGRRWGGAKPGQLESVEKRLARLEVAIDDLTSEIGHMTQGQQLVTKLLADRSRELSEAPHVGQ